MRQVVLSLSEESEERLRRLALRTRNGRKGALSQTVEDALLLLEKRLKQGKALERLQEISTQNRALGVGKFDREEAYN